MTVVHEAASIPMPHDEMERLRVVRELDVLGTKGNPAFDAVARLACFQTGCPVGAISIVDAERQCFLASVGLSEKETSRDEAFCAHSICSSDGLEVADARRDFVAQSLGDWSPPSRASAMPHRRRPRTAAK